MFTGHTLTDSLTDSLTHSLEEVERVEKAECESDMLLLLLLFLALPKFNTQDTFATTSGRAAYSLTRWLAD